MPHVPGTYTGSYGTGITVTVSSATIASSASFDVTVASSVAVYSALASQSLLNFGVVEDSGTSGVGIELAAGGTITNDSTIEAEARQGRAVVLGQTGGLVANAGQIYGAQGISSGGTASLINSGIIEASGGAAVYFGRGGTVTNGSVQETDALIAGVAGVLIRDGLANTHGLDSGSILNFGTILASGTKSADAGAFADGSIANGSASDANALIAGYVGVFAYGSVTNFGTILGMTTMSSAGGATTVGGFGVNLDWGKVTNGSSSDTMALIEGVSGGVSVGISSDTTSGGTVANFGTIGTLESGSGAGISLFASATVINGGITDSAALITGENASRECRGYFRKRSELSIMERFPALPPVRMQTGTPPYFPSVPLSTGGKRTDPL